MYKIESYDDAKEVIFKNSQKDFLRYHLFGSDCILFASKNDIEVLFLDLPDDIILSDHVKEEIIRRHETLLREDEMEYCEQKLRDLRRDWDRSLLEQITRRYPRVLDSELTFIGEAMSLVMEYPINISNEDDPMDSLKEEIAARKNDINFRKLYN